MSKSLPSVFPAKVIRFADYDRKSRDADAVSPRDPADSAVIIVLPMIRVERIEPAEQREQLFRTIWPDFYP